MKHRIFTIVVAALVSLAAHAAAADLLRGRLSGLEHQRDRVDLRMRFFATGEADRLLTELRFDQVELDAGTFEVSLDDCVLPPDARFIAIALRPSARRYAAYQPIPPRRRLERWPGTVLIAAARNTAPTKAATRLPIYHGIPSPLASGER